jgi:3-methyladenine DNA glycosylase AlkC
MKYYNSELDGNSGKALDEKVLKDLLEYVRKSINRSLNKLNETEEVKNSLDHKIGSSSNNTSNIATGIINQAKEELEA